MFQTAFRKGSHLRGTHLKLRTFFQQNCYSQPQQTLNKIDKTVPYNSKFLHFLFFSTYNLSKEKERGH